MSKSAAREEFLMKVLKSSGRISTADATAMLGVSEATARRIFTALEKNGQAVRDYGGIQMSTPTDSYHFEKYERLRLSEKQRIGRAAAALVESGDTVYLDCGTTVQQMTLALSQRLAAGDVTAVNIVTNSLANLLALPSDQNCRVILAGGEYSFKRRDFSGPITERYIEPFHFSKCFLGCEGVTAQGGFMSNRLSLSSLNSKALERAEKSYVLSDCSKFGRGALTAYATFSQVTAIITDQSPDDAMRAAMNRAGMNIVVAPEGKAEKEGKTE